MVRLMCAPPKVNLKPNFSSLGEAVGKPNEEIALDIINNRRDTLLADWFFVFTDACAGIRCAA